MINETLSFYINDTTGLITVNAPSLDRELHSSYTLVVTVGLGKKLRQLLLIVIRELKEHHPVIEHLPQS